MQFNDQDQPIIMSQGSRRETLRQQIDENLRRVYQEKIEEGIPDRFAHLLSQLRQQDGSMPAEPATKLPDHTPDSAPEDHP